MRLSCIIGVAAAIAIFDPAAAKSEPLRLTQLPANDLSVGQPQPKRPRPELKTLNDFGRAVSRCWKPPGRSEAPPDIMVTVKLSFTREGEVFGKPLVTYITAGTSPEHELAYRKAVVAAFQRCTPFNLSKGLGDAIAGRPFTFSFGNEHGRHDAQRLDRAVAYLPPM
jgi:hypothetical protein